MNTITESGQHLREALLDATGYDPTTEPAFDWSDTLPCDGCETRGSTALVILEGDSPAERLCFNCYADRML